MSLCKLLPNQKPKIKRWSMSRAEMKTRVLAAGMYLPAPDLPWDNKYFYTNREGWMKIIWDLCFKSSLYKKDIFDCENLAFKAWLRACEEYDLNTFCPTIGDIPEGRHGFNVFYCGDPDTGESEWMMFEPNDGFPGNGIMEWLGDGYRPDEWFG